MSASNSFETSLLQHIFQNADIANVGDATGLRGSTVAGSLYLSLHTADPGEAGTQATSEATYTSYARVAVVRTSGAWSVASGVATNLAAIAWPAATGGTNTATYFGIGVASSGATLLLFSGILGSSLAISNGITPQADIGAITVTAD